MKRKLLSLLLTCTLILSGCSWMDGSYHSVTPHEEHAQTDGGETVSASNYMQLRGALESMISKGQESGVIYVADFDQSKVESFMDMAVRYVRGSYPIGAYAVEDMRYEIGTSSGKPAIAVEITYLRSYAEIRQIRSVEDMDEAMEVIAQSLRDHDSGVVLLVEEYEAADIAQLAETYALENPDKVMEMPQVTTGIYPNEGTSRVVEVKLTYQNSRESLRQMQDQVESLFTSAAMYISKDAADYVKYNQLYTFLMERFDYQLDTSITPAYSLLRHGVGDSKAFATVYAAMCRQSGLECQVVTGTRAGEPWNWNMVCDNGLYFHVDLLRSEEQGGFRELLDGDMTGYVWDYSAYPACDAAHSVQGGSDQAEETAETTVPTEPVEQETTENEKN